MKSLTINFFLVFTLLINHNYSQEIVNHAEWDNMLILNVTTDGMVDYEGVTADATMFYKYFRYLQTISPKEDWSMVEKLAYWINVYNATAMKLIIDEYPIESINEIENAWKRKVFKSEGVRYSLDNIEHDILRKFGDPRIDFLINCGYSIVSYIY